MPDQLINELMSCNASDCNASHADYVFFVNVVVVVVSNISIK